MEMNLNTPREELRKQILAMRETGTGSEHTGNYWSEEEDNTLCRMFAEGYGMTEIALALNRTEPATVQRAEHFQLFARQRSVTRQRRNQNCKCGACSIGPCLRRGQKEPCHVQ